MLALYWPSLVKLFFFLKLKNFFYCELKIKMHVKSYLVFNSIHNKNPLKKTISLSLNSKFNAICYSEIIFKKNSYKWKLYVIGYTRKY